MSLDEMVFGFPIRLWVIWSFIDLEEIEAVEVSVSLYNVLYMYE